MVSPKCSLLLRKPLPVFLEKKVILRGQEQGWSKEGVLSTVVRGSSRRSVEFLSSLKSTMCKVEVVQ